MKKILIFSIVWIIFTGSLPLFAEVTVLPADTVISKPGTPTVVLDTSMFLFTREDMERAVLAMETVLIRDDQILKLTASWNDLAGKVIVTGVIAAVATFLAVELFHALRR